VLGAALEVPGAAAAAAALEVEGVEAAFDGGGAAGIAAAALEVPGAAAALEEPGAEAAFDRGGAGVAAALEVPGAAAAALLGALTKDPDELPKVKAFGAAAGDVLGKAPLFFSSNLASLLLTLEGWPP
jgi:hypothetical protein